MNSSYAAYLFVTIWVQCTLLHAVVGWSSGNAVKGACNLGKTQAHQNTVQCPTPAKNYSLTEAASYGWKFAPILYQHPAEWSYLTDPAEWFDKAAVYTTIEGLNVSNDRVDSLKYSTVSGPSAYATTLGHLGSQIPYDVLRELVAGDPVIDDKITGKVWFTVFDSDGVNVTEQDNLLVYVFHMFYPFQGCSNQLFSTQYDDQYQGIQYYKCPDGAAEGDWEYMTVVVCKAALEDDNTTAAIQAIQYAQPEGSLIGYNCSSGECSFELGDDGLMHPVTYAALLGHGNYPAPSPLNVVEEFSLPGVDNFDGLFRGDPTTAGARFMPTPNNTLYLSIESNATWATFLGSWGVGLTANETSITCWFNNFTEEAPCNDTTPPYALYLQYATPDTTTPANLTWLTSPTHAQYVSNPTNQGPLARRYTYFYQMDRALPHPPSFCPMDGTLKGQAKQTLNNTQQFLYYNNETTTLSGSDPAIAGFIIGMACFIIITGVVIGGMLFWPLVYMVDPPKGPVQPLPKDALAESDGTADVVVLRESSKIQLKQVNGKKKMFVISRNRIWIVFATALYIPGMVLTGMGLKNCFTALNLLYDTSFWELVKRALLAVSILFGIITVVVTILAIITRVLAKDSLFGASYGYMKMSNTVHKKRTGCAEKWGWRLNAVLGGLLMVEMNVTMVIFTYGVLVWLAKAVVQMACNTIFAQFLALLSNNGDAICINFSVLGGRFRDVCGDELAGFCNAWDGLDVTYVVWGSFLFLSSQVVCFAIVLTQLVTLRLGATLRDEFYNVQQETQDNTDTGLGHDLGVLDKESEVPSAMPSEILCYEPVKGVDGMALAPTNLGCTYSSATETALLCEPHKSFYVDKP